jgi:hypothetical protein
MVAGGDRLAQNVMIIENGPLSSVNMYVKRFSIQDEISVVLTSVMPLVKASRITAAVVNGVRLGKVPFDTQLVSDSNVKLWCALTNYAELDATAGFTGYSQYAFRSHTVVGQVISDDRNILPLLVENTGDKWTLLPGESLLVQIVSPTTLSNTSAHTWFAQVVWEEEAATFFSISGIVTLSGSPVTGAKVMVVQADDDILTNAILKEVKTTGVDGSWSSTIPHGKVGAAFVQYKDGSTLYTAPGSPFLEE